MTYTQKELNKANIGEILDEAIESQKIYSFEGCSGVKNFEAICNMIGYDKIEEFLADNSGCIENMVDWIKNSGVEEWKENLINYCRDNDIIEIIEENEEHIQLQNKDQSDDSDEWQQICIWPGTLVGSDKIKEFEEFFNKEFKCRVKYLEEVKTNSEPGDTTGETGGRNDVFFAINKDDIMKFSIPRLQIGIRWLEDVIKYNNNSYLYPEEILKKYRPKW